MSDLNLTEFLEDFWLIMFSRDTVTSLPVGQLTFNAPLNFHIVYDDIVIFFNCNPC